MVQNENKIQILKDYIHFEEIKTRDFLEIAMSITEELAKIHSQNIIYRDINPFNIIVDTDSKKVFIKKSPISIKANAYIISDKSDIIAGNLQFISPEQTGILNLTIDYRSDLYSLGIVFYEMLTGKPPFYSEDLTELVHAHVAITPISPHEINQNIFYALSNIVLKLLKKSPHERYQSVFGLLADFNKCLNQLEQKDKIETFSLGKNDISSVFRIPEKLYGRRVEQYILKSKFSKVKNKKKEILFISGTPGIGKSFLVKETHDYFIKEGGRFISGKFEQYKDDIPYSAVIEAFRDLIRQLLSKNNNEMELWKNNIMNALNINVQIIIDVIPELEWIVGKQSQVEKLSPDETRNRFNYVFHNFIQVFISESQPLVVFLDDLQWADSASLEFIDVILSDSKLSSILFIGAFRNVEAEDNLALKTLIMKLQNNNHNYTALALKAVDEDYISTILKDLLAKEFAKNDTLVNFIVNKTSGNPMFIKEFLIYLYKKGFIRFSINGYASDNDKKNTGWQIDMEDILNSGLPVSIVDIITDRIEKLSYETGNILKLASCIGVDFSMTILSKIYGKPEEQLAVYLKEAIDEGIIIKRQDAFTFVHDKVQEVLYNLTDVKEKESNHYSIGKLLLNRSKMQNTNEDIFKIVHQLNLVKEWLKVEEKNILIKLNLKAGHNSKASTAYNATVFFLKQGMTLLPIDSWTNDYQITLSYFTELLEAEYLSKNYQEFERLSEIIFAKATCCNDRIKAYELKIDYYTGQMRYNDFFNTAKAALKEFDFLLPDKISKFTVLKEKLPILLKLKKISVSDLLNLPTITAPEAVNLIKLMVKIADAAYHIDPYLFGFLIIHGVRISLQHGNCPGTAYFYAGIATFYCQPGIFNDVDKGYELSKFAIELNNKYYSRSLHTRVLFANTFVTHWKEPLSNNLNNYLKVIDLCLNNGDTQYLSFTILYYTISYLLMGKNLQETTAMIHKYIHYDKQSQQSQLDPYFILLKQNLNNNSGESVNRLFLTSFYLTKSFMFYLYGENNKGIELCKNEKSVIDGLGSNPIVPIFYFFYALHLATAYFSSHKKNRIIYYHKLRMINKKFEKWSQHNQSTYCYMNLLITAEISCIKKQYETAANLYKKSIDLAKDNEFKYCQAIANECAGEFYVRRKMLNEASHYINEAYQCYETWGAKTKLKKMIKKYSEFITVKKNAKKSTTVFDNFINTESNSYTFSLSNLDFQSITEAANLLLNEKDVNKVLSSLLTILTKNSGAERTVLLLNMDGKLFIETECVVDKGKITAISSSSLKEDSVPESVIRFVLSSKEAISFADLTKAQHFLDDKYFLQNNTKSLLCIPIVRQENLYGVIYMEHNQFSDVFAFKRQDSYMNIVKQITMFLESNLRKKLQLNYNELSQGKSAFSLGKILSQDYHLTKQEIKVTLLFRNGLSREEVCDSLNISYNTLRNHLKMIYNKTVNPKNEDCDKPGRVDKLSKLMLFLTNIENNLNYKE